MAKSINIKLDKNLLLDFVYYVTWHTLCQFYGNRIVFNRTYIDCTFANIMIIKAFHAF